MAIITGDYFSTIQYNDSSIKTNGLNLAVTDGLTNDKVKLTLTASTSGRDSDGMPVFGRGENITYTIGISNFNDTDLTGIKAPITSWNFTTAVPIVLNMPVGINIKDFSNAGVEVGSESPYIIYTENGVSTKMKRVRTGTDYTEGMYAYRILDNVCTLLIPKFSSQSSAYITFITEKNGDITLGSTLTANATLDFTENTNESPITSTDVTIKYAYVDLSAEKKAPVSVYYNEEFSYQIVISNSGNLPAEINKISDILPGNFTVSQDDNSKYKIGITRNETTLKQDTDFICTIKKGSFDVTPFADGKLNINGGSKLTVTITGKMTKY